MFAALLDRLYQRTDLTPDEAASAMAAIMDGQATGAQIAALLMALRLKGEKPAEIVGFARTMRDRAVKLARVRDDVFDTCGTGGDGAGTINVSSIAALVLAACGVRVAKHGNRSVSSRCGSADVFEALGVNVAAPPAIVEECLDSVGLGFFFAPTFHPSMKQAAPTRRELGVPTAFNLLGPLTNPAGARRQLVGVPRPEMTELVARSLSMLGTERAWVVHGADRLDEISTCGYTKVSECRGGLLNTFYVHPSEFGLRRARLADVVGGDAATNAAVTREVLAGRAGPARDIVLLNAGAGLLVAGRATSVREGIRLAADAVDGGAALTILDRLVRTSNREVAA
jgi:anthranilate phosphoribosyltransferase